MLSCLEMDKEEPKKKKKKLLQFVYQLSSDMKADTAPARRLYQLGKEKKKVHNI